MAKKVPGSEERLAREALAGLQIYGEITVDDTGRVHLVDAQREYRVACPEDVAHIRVEAAMVVARSEAEGQKEIGSTAYRERFPDKPTTDWPRPLNNAFVVDLKVDHTKHDLKKRIDELNAAIRTALLDLVRKFDDGGTGTQLFFATFTDASSVTNRT